MSYMDSGVKKGDMDQDQDITFILPPRSSKVDEDDSKIDLLLDIDDYPVRGGCGDHDDIDDLDDLVKRKIKMRKDQDGRQEIEEFLQQLAEESDADDNNKVDDGHKDDLVVCDVRLLSGGRRLEFIHFVNQNNCFAGFKIFELLPSSKYEGNGLLRILEPNEECNFPIGHHGHTGHTVTGAGIGKSISRTFRIIGVRLAENEKYTLGQIEKIVDNEFQKFRIKDPEKVDEVCSENETELDTHEVILIYRYRTYPSSFYEDGTTIKSVQQEKIKSSKKYTWEVRKLKGNRKEMANSKRAQDEKYFKIFYSTALIILLIVAFVIELFY